MPVLSQSIPTVAPDGVADSTGTFIVPEKTAFAAVIEFPTVIESTFFMP